MYYVHHFLTGLDPTHISADRSWPDPKYVDRSVIRPDCDMWHRYVKSRTEKACITDSRKNVCLLALCIDLQGISKITFCYLVYTFRLVARTSNIYPRSNPTREWTHVRETIPTIIKSLAPFSCRSVVRYLIMPGKRCFCLTSVWRLTSVCLSVAYIGRNSRTERHRKTKIGTEVAHVTRDPDTTFKVKRSKVNVLLMSLIANMPEQVPPGE